MERKKVSVLEIIYGLLLKFGKVDDSSVNVIIQGLSNKNIIEIDDHSKYYVVTEDGFILLNPNAIEDILKQINNVQLEQKQSDIVKKYLNNMSLSEFVLRKIKLYGYIPIDKEYISDFFSVSEIVELKKLIKDGYLIDYWEEACIYDDYHVVELTKKGEVSLFSSDNSRKIDAFFKSLGIEYDEGNKSIKEDFLMTQNLDLKVRDILNIDSFIAFCRDYDRVYPKGYSLLRSKKSEKNNNID